MTAVQHAILQHKSPEKVVHYKVVKPQAATTHQLNADESPGKIFKPQAETISAGYKDISAERGGILL